MPKYQFVQTVPHCVGGEDSYEIALTVKQTTLLKK